MPNFTAGSGVSKAQIDDIKERIHIEDVVKRYVPLKHVGKNLFGLCPFHSEKSPSFSVNPELNLFKCYGCGEGGDVITFLQKIESLEFQEALEVLAKEAGVTLSFKKRDPRESKRFDRAVKAHDLAAHYFSYLLLKHAVGKDAYAYTQKRNISDEAIASFTIGYAPGYRSSVSLSRFLLKQGFTPGELVDFGLCTNKNGVCVDKFIDRLMFSIHDSSGTVIGFSGRVFKKDDERPKYINSPETVIFQKRKQLFGLHQAKQAIRTSDSVILVEGQIDAISSWQSGIKNIVAPLGTGITRTQLERLKRYTENLSIAFDNDEAGIKAHYKLSMEAYSLGFQVSSVEIPYGKDVDECISHDPSLWKKATENKLPTVSFLLNHATQKADPATLQGKQYLVKYAAPILSAMSDKISVDHHIKELHLLTDVPVDMIVESLKSPSLAAQDIESISTRKPVSTRLTHGMYIISILLQFPAIISWATERLDPETFSDESDQLIITRIIEHTREKGTFNASDFILRLPLDVQEYATDLLMRPIWKAEPNTQEVTTEVTDALSHMKTDRLKAKLTEIRKKLALAEHQDDTRAANDLLNSINDTLKELEALQTENR